MLGVWDWLCGVAFIAAKPLMRIYFRLRKSTRVRVLIMCGNEILLVKNCFGTHRWALPGGGVKSGEALEGAASREIWEEIGLRIDPGEMIQITETEYGFEEQIGYKSVVFVAKINQNSQLTLRRREIMAAKWFNRGEAMENIAEIVPKTLRNLPKSLS